MKSETYLTSFEAAKDLDNEAALWGLNSFSLTEAAGRSCAEVFLRHIGKHTAGKKTVNSFAVLAGSGNNGTDALIMLKALCFKGYADPSLCKVFLTHNIEDTNSPLSQILCLIKKIDIPVNVWDGQSSGDGIENFDYIIDGITGTGLKSELHGNAALMLKALQKPEMPKILSIDIPSGNFEGWKPPMPIISAYATLAIEPQKTCLYNPAARPYAGKILPVTGIFPSALLRLYSKVQLVNWMQAKTFIPQVKCTAHKYERGLVVIRAGSKGFAGAAKLAALGSQAAGAGLVRLIVDPQLHPEISPACFGIMAVPSDQEPEEGRFSPNSILLGPGWGKSKDRRQAFLACLEKEKQGIPLILDADAIALAKDQVFNGNVIITPHAGEFAAFAGVSKVEILSDPIPHLLRVSKENNLTVLFKSHVLYICSQDGRIGIIDGMNAALATGGTGDVLAGFCAAIAARLKPFDGYNCACAAALLLQEAAKAKKLYRRFAGPEKIANAASFIAGRAWLQEKD